jgi:hypothetical protein
VCQAAAEVVEPARLEQAEIEVRAGIRGQQRERGDSQRRSGPPAAARVRPQDAGRGDHGDQHPQERVPGGEPVDQALPLEGAEQRERREAAQPGRGRRQHRRRAPLRRRFGGPSLHAA